MYDLGVQSKHTGGSQLWLSKLIITQLNVNLNT